MNHHDPSLGDLVDRATPESAPPFGDVLARRGRRRNRRRAAAAGVASVAVVAAIATGSTLLGTDATTDPDPAPAPSVTDTSHEPSPALVAPDWDGEGVPPLTLMLADRMVVLAPWSYCYAGTCLDGKRAGQIDDIGSPEAVRFAFPVSDWDFEAKLTQVGVDCPRSITVPATRTSPTSFEVPPAGAPGTYDVSLFGRGDGGDLSFRFRWTTPTSGAFPEPEGRVGIVSWTGDDVNPYAPELTFTNLATTPARATAEITVTAADGASRTLPVLHPMRGCGSEGTLSFNGTQEMSAGLADLGPLPFTYSVRLVMDGSSYTGTATYPGVDIDLETLREQLEALATDDPFTPLTWDPPLPGYTG